MPFNGSSFRRICPFRSSSRKRARTTVGGKHSFSVVPEKWYCGHWSIKPINIISQPLEGYLMSNFKDLRLSFLNITNKASSKGKTKVKFKTNQSLFFSHQKQFYYKPMWSLMQINPKNGSAGKLDSFSIIWLLHLVFENCYQAKWVELDSAVFFYKCIPGSNRKACLKR